MFKSEPARYDQTFLSKSKCCCILFWELCFLLFKVPIKANKSEYVQSKNGEAGIIFHEPDSKSTETATQTQVYKKNTSTKGKEKQKRVRP